MPSGPLNSQRRNAARPHIAATKAPVCLSAWLRNCSGLAAHSQTALGLVYAGTQDRRHTPVGKGNPKSRRRLHPTQAVNSEIGPWRSLRKPVRAPLDQL